VDEFQSDGTFKAAYTERLEMRREKFVADLTELLQPLRFSFDNTVLANTNIPIFLVSWEYDESTADLTSWRCVVLVALINLATPFTTKL
jgi:hypothetical protein